MVERALYAIWNSTLNESEGMSSILTKSDLRSIESNNSNSFSILRKCSNRIFITLSKVIMGVVGQFVNK